MGILTVAPGGYPGCRLFYLIQKDCDQAVLARLGGGDIVGSGNRALRIRIRRRWRGVRVGLVELRVLGRRLGPCRAAALGAVRSRPILAVLCRIGLLWVRRFIPVFELEQLASERRPLQGNSACSELDNTRLLKNYSRIGR